MKRLVLGLLGALLALIGLGMLGGGSVLLAVFGTDNQARIPIGKLTSDSGRAVVVTDFQISSSTPLPVDESWFDLELEVTAKEPLFVGVAPKPASLNYLQGVPYELVTGIDSSNDTLNSATIPGDRVPSDPTALDIWSDQQSGRANSVAWPVSDNDTTLVVMNADAATGVRADVAVRATVGWASALAIGLMIAGLVLLVVSIVVLVLAFRANSGDDVTRTGPPTTVA